MDFKVSIISRFKGLKEEMEFSFKSIREQVGNLSKEMEARQPVLNGNSVSENYCYTECPRNRGG